MMEKKPYARILAALDVASDEVDRVLRKAMQVSPDAEVTAMHVVDVYPYAGEVAFRPAKMLHDRLMEESDERLKLVCSRAGVVRRMLVEGHAAREICRYVEEHGVDLVVLGGHGRHGWRPLLGSTASAVMHSRVCDAFCVHTPVPLRPLREILVAVDAGEEAREVLSRALQIAEASGARTSLISVLRPIVQSYGGLDVAAYGEAAMRFHRDAEAQLTANLETLGNDFGVTGDRLLREGHPATQIHAAAKEQGTDLIVIGTHGKHGLSGLLGSTANAVLHGAQSDVLAVRISE